MCRLKHICSVLQVWNFSIFEDLKRLNEDCSSRLKGIQLEMESAGFSND